ncbi:MAG: DUF3616 domain-containing protein [Planctomycetia bacterium]|nr:DUF3616 domain-containing protein [Planctomycetia bacterium]
MSAPAGRLTMLGPIPFSASLPDPKNVSGIAFVHGYVLLVSDETAQVEVLRAEGSGFASVGTIRLGRKKDELDLEAVAADDDVVYVVGSHSRVRQLPAPDAPYADARAKMTAIKKAPERDVLIRFKLKTNGRGSGLKTSSLRRAITNNRVLAPFANLPSKENGIDIEGLAIRGKQLYIGFRGPVLRGNFVPVLVTRFGKSKGDVLFVNLEGRGIRAMAAVSDGFLILAGPMGDGPGSFQIYHWNGGDCLPGADPAGSCVLLCELPVPAGQKPEGFAVLEKSGAYEFVLVSDGAPNGGPTAYRLELIAK